MNPTATASICLLLPLMVAVTVSAVIGGRRADDVWPVMEELMEVLRVTNKPLYKATLRKIQD